MILDLKLWFMSGYFWDCFTFLSTTYFVLVYLKQFCSQLFIIFEELYSLCLMLNKDDLWIMNCTKWAVTPTAWINVLYNDAI